VAETLEQVLQDVAPDAEALGCATNVARCRAIVGAGTSADAQMRVFEAHEKNESRERALGAVNDWLAAATLQ
jgi:carboxylate-amine ligase